MQVPGGTCRPGEAPAAAVLREVAEETGYDCFGPPRALGTAGYRVGAVTHVRHFFQLAPAAPLPETWEAAERHDGERPPTAFVLSWLPLAQGHVLAAGLGALLWAVQDTGAEG